MNIKTVLAFVGVSLGVLIGIAALLWRMGGSSTQPLADVAGEEHNTLGSGQVVLVEFSDFQCPACSGVQEPLKELLSKYEGKVKFVYRHFPLSSIHKNALKAAYAAEAARKQMKFFEYGDMLFKTQGEWSELADPTEKFANYASILGMDTAQFLADMNSSDVSGFVTTDLAYANKHALTGTPSFFVNGVQTDFAALDSKLAELTK